MSVPSLHRESTDSLIMLCSFTKRCSCLGHMAEDVGCTCNSCLMVFTVCGICTAQGLYVLPRVEPEEVHTA